jgi:hypothetical protein
MAAVVAVPKEVKRTREILFCASYSSCSSRLCRRRDFDVVISV